MATADKLNKLLETKKAIKDAIIEKGVEVGNKFAEYPDKIRAIQGGGGEPSAGGGDLIYVENGTDKEYAKGDKVLINLGMVDEVDLNESVTSTSSYYNTGVVFYDNDTVFILFKNVERKYIWEGGRWIKNTDPASWSLTNYPGISCHKNGIVSLQSYFNTAAEILGINGKINSQKLYAGEFAGMHFVYEKSAGKWYQYDIANNTTIGNVIVDGENSGFCGFIQDTGDCFDITGGNKITFFKLNESLGLMPGSKLITMSIDSGARLEAYTGASIGNYIFMGTNFQSAFCLTTPSGSSFFTYQIVDDGNGSKNLILRDDLFKEFQSIDAECQFDMRNDILTIGTKDEVYTYKLNRDTYEFENLGISFELPETTGYTRYRLAYSPDMTKAMVTIRTTKEQMKYRIYGVYANKTKIVENDSARYQPVNSITGFVTGNTDEEGKLEVKTVLPEKVDITITTDVDVKDDEITILGV